MRLRHSAVVGSGRGCAYLDSEYRCRRGGLCSGTIVAECPCDSDRVREGKGSNGVGAACRMRGGRTSERQATRSDGAKVTQLSELIVAVQRISEARKTSIRRRPTQPPLPNMHTLSVL